MPDLFCYSAKMPDLFCYTAKLLHLFCNSAKIFDLFCYGAKIFDLFCYRFLVLRYLTYFGIVPRYLAYLYTHITFCISRDRLPVSDLRCLTHFLNDLMGFVLIVRCLTCSENSTKVTDLISHTAKKHDLVFIF